MPVIPGLESFPGLVMHSHYYGHLEVFQGKHLVILGAASSGQDIFLQAAKHAENVYLSHKNTLSCKLLENVERHRPIKSVSVDGAVLFEHGQEKLREES